MWRKFWMGMRTPLVCNPRYGKIPTRSYWNWSWQREIRTTSFGFWAGRQRLLRTEQWLRSLVIVSCLITKQNKKRKDKKLKLPKKDYAEDKAITKFCDKCGLIVPLQLECQQEHTAMSGLVRKRTMHVLALPSPYKAMVSFLNTKDKIKWA